MAGFMEYWREIGFSSRLCSYVNSIYVKRGTSRGLINTALIYALGVYIGVSRQFSFIVFKVVSECQ